MGLQKVRFFMKLKGASVVNGLSANRLAVELLLPPKNILELMLFVGVVNPSFKAAIFVQYLLLYWGSMFHFSLMMSAAI